MSEVGSIFILGRVATGNIGMGPSGNNDTHDCQGGGDWTDLATSLSYATRKQSSSTTMTEPAGANIDHQAD